MIVRIIIISIFVLISTFLFISLNKRKAKFRANENKYTVCLPKQIGTLGYIFSSMMIFLMLCFTIFSEELPHMLMYFCFGVFVILGMYLTLKASIFNVGVNNGFVEVSDIFFQRYSFVFDDVTSATKQTKSNKVNSQRIVVITKQKRKLIVENGFLNYQRFSDSLEKNLPSNKLVGF